MARLARVCEAALVRILMARSAFRERQTRVFDVGLGIRYGRMTLRARDVRVRAGQRILCLGVIKERGWLPIFSSVAAGAILSELPAVFVLMAAYAFARKPEICAIEVLDDDAGSRRRWNEFCFVTLLAGDPGVFSRQCKSRLAVVHRFALGFPVN